MHLGTQLLHDVILIQSDQLQQMWTTMQENDFESETEELLHYYRTQTLTKDYSDFLLQTVKTNNGISSSALMLLEKRPKVILEGLFKKIKYLIKSKASVLRSAGHVRRQCKRCVASFRR